MLVSQAWLNEWVRCDLDSDALAERLTMAGLEVGGVEALAAFDRRLVVGRITAIEPHPDADRLQVCRVDVGRRHSLTIVCGARNARAGLIGIVALVGARLPGGLEISRRKVRGVESSGMLCSLAELGLEEHSEGIIELDDGQRPGTLANTVLERPDTVLDVDLTPNRGDCLSLCGIAREVAALTGDRLRSPASLAAVAAVHRDSLTVRLEAPAACPRYTGRVIRDVDVNASTPPWMKERLRRAGLRSLGPCVDVTNYVMLELGQPMHAFDLETLEKGIVVRYANGRERLELLDGSTIRPLQSDLVIADHKRAIALAGVMGGMATAVGEGTRDIFLESAYFTPEVIAVTARDRGIRSDSSHRFERGVDPALQRDALERATRLLLQIAGGRPGPVVEKVASREMPRRESIELRSGQLAQLLGVTVPAERIRRHLRALGMQVRGRAERLTVVPPSYRFDVTREADLIEEVARLEGYATIPETPPLARMQVIERGEAVLPQQRLQDLLIGRGYQEVITYSFIGRDLHDRLAPHHPAIELLNPISADMGVMRATLWPGLLGVLRHNLNRQVVDQRLFETGRTFVRKGRKIVQEPYLGGLLTGSIGARHWSGSGHTADFFDLKGDVEALLGLGGRLADFSFEAVEHPALHPGQSALIREGRAVIGLLGRLHPAIEHELDLDQPVYLFEIELAALLRGGVPQYTPISRYPAIQRDIALVLDQGTPASSVGQCIRNHAGKLLVNLELFDQYQGEHIDFGKKSLAFTLTLQDSSRTLTDVDVDDIMQRVIEGLRDELAAHLR